MVLPVIQHYHRRMFILLGLLLLLLQEDAHPWILTNCFNVPSTNHHYNHHHDEHRRLDALKSAWGEASAGNRITTNSPTVVGNHDKEDQEIATELGIRNGNNNNNDNILIREFLTFFKLLLFSLIISFLIISWEDISMCHPMRKEASFVSMDVSTSSASFDITSWGRSTVRGMGFGRQERFAVAAVADLEPNTATDLLSYNEVMLSHRANRIPLWDKTLNTNAESTSISSSSGNEISIENKAINTDAISRKDVSRSISIVQQALLRILDCEVLARNYEWDQLIATLNERLLRSDLEQACYILKAADEFLSRDQRDEIGFDWGSCAWRHCGALSDAQEAIDQLDMQIGMLEPYECLFVLDVAERSLRDILAVTVEYHHDDIITDTTGAKIPEYKPIQRMSDVPNDEGLLDRTETDYLNTLSILRNSDV